MNNDREFWQALFSARGRSGRSRFWKVFGLQLLIILIALSVAEWAGLTDTPSPLLIAIMGCAGLVMIAASYVGLVNIIKRLHDLGATGWWVLAMAGNLLAGLGTLAFVAIGCIEGEPRPNRFDDPPRVPAAEPEEQAA